MFNFVICCMLLRSCLCPCHGNKDPPCRKSGMPLKFHRTPCQWNGSACLLSLWNAPNLTEDDWITPASVGSTYLYPQTIPMFGPTLNWESKPHKMSSDCNFWAPVWSMARANFEVYCSCGQTFLACPFHMGIFQTCSLWPGRSDSYVARRISLWPAVTRFQHPDTRSLHSVDGYHPLALAPAQPGYWPG